MGLLSKKSYFKNIFVFIFLGYFSSTIFASFNFSNQSATLHVTSGGRLVMVPAVAGWAGTLHQEGVVSGSSIGFDGGVLRVEDTPAFFRGTYNSSGAQQITLDGNKTLNVGSGDLAKRILVSSSGNKILGQLAFADDTVAAPNIQLQNSSAGLSLGVQGKLVSFVKLAGGTVTLTDDLNFGDCKRFDGVGTIHLNNKRVSFGGRDLHMTETVLWSGASDVVLNSKTILSGLWTFDGAGPAKEAHINGNGNILDLGTTGSIRVRSGTTLYLTDIKLKGLGDGGYGSFVFDDDTCQVRLSQAEIELSNNYSVTNGGFYVEGASRIVTRDKNLIFALNGTLTVDGITFEYDTARFVDNNNIVPANRGASTANITLLNNGAIAAITPVETVATACDLAKETSNALLYASRTNSTAIVSQDKRIRYNSNALMYGDRTNSTAIVSQDKRIRYNSNALMYGDRTNSTAIVSQDRRIRNNSNALVYGDRTNSTAIVFQDRRIRNNSNVLLYGLRITSNALLYGDRADGMANIIYKPTNYVFRDGEVVRGFVRYNNGFTVLPGANHASNIFLDTCISVSGSIDLRSTSTITLLGDLKLDSNSNFTSSGYIKSNGSSIIMGDDLTLARDTVLHCRGQLVIDGNGKTLYISPNAQLFLDTDATVTLRNMNIRTYLDYPGQPAINLAAQTTKLALDNVTFELGNDFYFRQGQLFIHNDVKVAGTSAFIYNSTMPSYITPQSCLTFDLGTSFSFAPATTSRDLLVMSDPSSKFMFNGSTLNTTHTGLRLTQGQLLFNNKATVNGINDNYINQTTPIKTPSIKSSVLTVLACFCSPDGKYIAAIGSNTFQICKFVGGALTFAGSAVAMGAPVMSSWSLDGKYIAIVDSSTNSLHVFAFSGGTPTQVGMVSTAASPRSCSWSPDGKYIVVGNHDSNNLQIFAFSGAKPVQIGSNVSIGSSPRSCSWSPDGKTIAVACSSTLKVFAFSGGTLTQIGGDISTGSTPNLCSWSPDGKYIALVTYVGNTLQVFSFSGGTPIKIGNDVSAGLNPSACSWSPDGKYISVVNRGNNALKIFSFFGGTPTQIGGDISTGSTPGFSFCSWCSNGQYIAVNDYSGVSGGFLQIFPVNYQPNTSMPTLGNCITLSNNARVLSGAQVAINGLVDNTSNLSFDDKSASIVMNSANSKLRLGDVSKVSGWGELSIVKNITYPSAGNWPEAYSNGVIISGDGATRPATDLVTTSSNAIVKLASQGIGTLPDWVRQTSDAVVQVRQNITTCPYINNAFDDGRSISDLFLDDQERVDTHKYLHDLGMHSMCDHLRTPSIVPVQTLDADEAQRITLRDIALALGADQSLNFDRALTLSYDVPVVDKDLESLFHDLV